LKEGFVFGDTILLPSVINNKLTSGGNLPRCILKKQNQLGFDSHTCIYIETANSKENTLPILNNVFLIDSRTVSHVTWNVDALISLEVSFALSKLIGNNSTDSQYQ